MKFDRNYSCKLHVVLVLIFHPHYENFQDLLTVRSEHLINSTTDKQVSGKWHIEQLCKSYSIYSTFFQLNSPYKIIAV